MRWLLRIVIIFMLISAGLSLLRGVLNTLMASRTKQKVRGANAVGGKLVRDPVCGTYIPEQTAFQSGDHMFCSEECRGKFLKAS